MKKLSGEGHFLDLLIDIEMKKVHHFGAEIWYSTWCQNKERYMSAVMKAIDETSDEYTPPAWHERVLARREKLYAEGKIHCA